VSARERVRERNGEKARKRETEKERESKRPRRIPQPTKSWQSGKARCGAQIACIVETSNSARRAYSHNIQYTLSPPPSLCVW